MYTEPAACEWTAVGREGQTVHAVLKATRQHSWQGRAIVEGRHGMVGTRKTMWWWGAWPFISRERPRVVSFEKLTTECCTGLIFGIIMDA